MQLQLSQAPFILCLGSVASHTIIPTARISVLRGNSLKREDTVFFFTFHPAAALRKPEWAQSMSQDIKTFSQIIQTDPSTEDWHQFFSGRCAVCNLPEEKMLEEHFGSDGLPYCQDHIQEAW